MPEVWSFPCELSMAPSDLGRTERRFMRPFQQRGSKLVTPSQQSSQAFLRGRTDSNSTDTTDLADLPRGSSTV